ncbi:MAG: hypothetical protein OER56_14815, partial [Hyphomicrobiales bacterium]|nr:hypothetical protein [Hyphomicrobiales bacterium]
MSHWTPTFVGVTDVEWKNTTLIPICSVTTCSLDNIGGRPLSLYYLIIPVLLFLLIAGVRALFLKYLPLGNIETARKAALSDLGRVVSVLMTAGLGERTVVLSVDRRVTSLRGAFHDTGVHLELPLITRQQIKRKNDLLSYFSHVCSEARLDADGD